MIPSSLAGHVLELFKLVDRTQQPVDRITADFFRERKYLGSHDRRYIAESIFSLVRHRRFLEALLEQYVSEHSFAAELDRAPLRYLPLFVAYSYLLSGKAIPENTLVSFWKTYFPKSDFNSYTGWISKNSALEFLPQDEALLLGVKYSFQDWMVAEWLKKNGPHTAPLLEAFNMPAAVTLRVNPLRSSRGECRERLGREGLATEPTQYSPSGLNAVRRFGLGSSQAFKDGWFEMQDEGSQLISLIAAPEPGDLVIDGCAGAGGKSLHMAGEMNNEGQIVSLDVEQRRLDELKERARRAGVSIIRPLLTREIQNADYLEKADIVLVDAPCSGAGTIRRNPWLKWSIREDAVIRYSERQLEILEFNSRFVKEGGRLIYATCSLFENENEGVVNAFLKRNPSFEGMNPPNTLKLPDHPSASPYVLLYPHKYPGDGYFVAPMRRREIRAS